ncbi:MAG: DUF721 domain-containing protein [Acidobacteriota bacterium]
MRSKPLPLAEILEPAIRSLPRLKEGDLVLAKSLWPRIAGTEVARHSSVEGLADGRLEVAADSAAWARTLQSFEGRIVAEARRLSGIDLRSLAVRHGRVDAPAASRTLARPLRLPAEPGATHHRATLVPDAATPAVKDALRHMIDAYEKCRGRV